MENTLFLCNYKYNSQETANNTWAPGRAFQLTSGAFVKAIILR